MAGGDRRARSRASFTGRPEEWSLFVSNDTEPFPTWLASGEEALGHGVVERVAVLPIEATKPEVRRMQCQWPA